MSEKIIYTTHRSLNAHANAAAIRERAINAKRPSIKNKKNKKLHVTFYDCCEESYKKNYKYIYKL